MKKRNMMIIIACVVVIFIGVLIYTQIIAPDVKYKKAIMAMKNKQYAEASIAFQELENYGDSKTRLLELQANELFDKGSYSEVVDIYSTLPVEYQDHADDLTEMFSKACEKRQAGAFDEAIKIFKSLGNYADAPTQIKETV